MHVLHSIGMVLSLALGLWLAAPEMAPAQVRTLRAMTVAGKRYLTLRDLAAMYGLPLTTPGGKELSIRGEYVNFQFTMNRREARHNGTRVWLHAPVTLIRGQWCISDADAQCLVDPLVRPSAYLGVRGTRTVVLDPGHGGEDPGALGPDGMIEKGLTLDIAGRVKSHLAAAGVRVVMTRTDDRKLTLENRPKLAARGLGDVFVSIHLNSAASRNVQGVETFVTPVENYPPTAESKLTGSYPAVANNQFNHSNSILGTEIQRALIGITRAEDRGLRRARFVVLKDSAMPAALVECGFLSNAQERHKLATASYRETLAQGIARGILNYLALVNRAKVELGAPVLQKPIQVAAPIAPVPAPPPQAPIPMAARAWGPTGVSVMAAAPEPSRPPVQVAPPAAPAEAPTVVPVVANSVPAVEVAAVAPSPAPPVTHDAPPPPPPPRARQANAAPPGKLLNPKYHSPPQ